MKIASCLLLLLSMISCSHFSSKNRKYSSEDLKIYKAEKDIRILLIQDDKDLLNEMKKLIKAEKSEWIIHTADNYKNSLEKFKELHSDNPFDFVVFSGGELGIDLAKEFVNFVNNNELPLPIMTLVTASVSKFWGKKGRDLLSEVSIQKVFFTGEFVDNIGFFSNFIVRPKQ